MEEAPGNAGDLTLYVGKYSKYAKYARYAKYAKNAKYAPLAWRRPLATQVIGQHGDVAYT